MPIKIGDRMTFTRHWEFRVIKALNDPTETEWIPVLSEWQTVDKPLSGIVQDAGEFYALMLEKVPLRLGDQQVGFRRQYTVERVRCYGVEVDREDDQFLVLESDIEE
jgi:hypothetical protein